MASAPWHRTTVRNRFGVSARSKVFICLNPPDNLFGKTCRRLVPQVTDTREALPPRPDCWDALPSWTQVVLARYDRWAMALPRILVFDDLAGWLPDHRAKRCKHLLL